MIFPRMFGDISLNITFSPFPTFSTFCFPVPGLMHTLANMDKVITDELFFITFLINYLLIIKYQLMFKKVCEIFPTETGTCNQTTLK